MKKKASLFLLISLLLLERPVFSQDAMKLPATTPSGTILSMQLLEQTGNTRTYQLFYASDGLAIESYLIEPTVGKNPFPGIVGCHEGIRGISPEFLQRMKGLAQQGYVVLLPQFRGQGKSTGTVEVAKGEVRDALNALTVLRKFRHVSPQHLSMLGTGQGGLTTLLSAAQTPHLQTAIAAYSVTDFAAWTEHLQKNGFNTSDPFTQKIFTLSAKELEQRSPLEQAEKISMPLFLIHGGRDDLVPLDQTLRFKNLLTKLGKKVKTTIFPKAQNGFLVYAQDPKRFSDEDRSASTQAWQEILKYLRSLRSGTS